MPHRTLNAAYLHLVTVYDGAWRVAETGSNADVAWNLAQALTIASTWPTDSSLCRLTRRSTGRADMRLLAGGHRRGPPVSLGVRRLARQATPPFLARPHFQWGVTSMAISRLGIILGTDGLPIISRVVVRDGTVYVCGVTPDPVGDVKMQTRQVLERIDRLLQSAGTDKSKLLSAQVWLSDMKLFADHNAVWNEWGGRKQSTCQGLRRSGAVASQYAR
jgi:enamine deaminase RidA (YjgF/YER057c/UK114 family)